MQIAEFNLSPVTKVTADTVRVERILPGPIERVWSLLVDAEKRRLWFAGGEMEQRAGGKATLRFQHSNITTEPMPARWKGMDDGDGFTCEVTVTAFDPPHRLSYTWPNGSHVSEVLFELASQGDEVRLTLTHMRLKDASEMRSVSGGWHAHLDVLDALLSGREPTGFWSTVLRLEKEYAKEFGV